jgi:hypothetical protein
MQYLWFLDVSKYDIRYAAQTAEIKSAKTSRLPGCFYYSTGKSICQNKSNYDNNISYYPCNIEKFMVLSEYPIAYTCFFLRVVD